MCVKLSLSIKKIFRLSIDVVFLFFMNLVRELFFGTISGSVCIFISLILFFCYVPAVRTSGCL